MIQNPTLWPRWPFLPVKRWVGHDLQCGLIEACTGRLTWVRIANLWGLPKTRAEFDALPKHEYPTPEALIADGWVVD
jgi:hypothetical protein